MRIGGGWVVSLRGGCVCNVVRWLSSKERFVLDWVVGDAAGDDDPVVADLSVSAIP